MHADSPVGKIVKVRWIKEYETAKNHVCVGEVRAQNSGCLVVFGRTYHFSGVHAGSTRGVRTGEVKTRWIPWPQIAVVTELPADLDWKQVAFKLDEERRLVFDNRKQTPIEEF